MSDVKDLTSQMAKELALGIKDNVEDIAAAFKKMAVINPERKRVAPVEIPAAETVDITEVLKAAAAENRRKPIHGLPTHRGSRRFMRACCKNLWKNRKNENRGSGWNWKIRFLSLGTPPRKGGYFESCIESR